MAVSAPPAVSRAVTGTEGAAFASAVLTAGLAGAAFLSDSFAQTPVFVALSLAACGAVVTAAWAVLRARRRLEAEMATLRATADALRAAQEAAVQAAQKTAARAAEQSPPRFATRRDALPSTRPAAPDSRPAEAQPSLALGAESAEPPISADVLVRALNFPDAPDDAEGFRALRLALAHPTAARAVRAAQDVLTLLAQDGIYMDDLPVERAKVELWRRFAQGERGRAVGPIGGVRDRSSLALTAARMRGDTIFRDAGHHFIRQFDRMLAEFEPGATDQQMSDLAATRTARAFMLLGRVMAIFD